MVITVRNLPQQLEVALKLRASREGKSLNRAVIELLEQALGLAGGQHRGRRHHELDSLFGSWSEPEAVAFDQALAEQRQVEDELWR